MNAIMRICVSRIDKLGDMILTLPAIKAIKISNPNTKIYVLASARNFPVLKGIKYIDEIIIIDTAYKIKNIINKILLIKRLKFDYFLNLSPTKLSYFLCFFSSAKYKAVLILLSRYKKSIFSNLLIRVFSKIFCQYVYIVDRYTKIKNNKEIHQTKMILNLINICKISCNNDSLIDISLPDKKLSIIPKNKDLITIHITDRWINKFYSEENFIDLVLQLPKKNLSYVLTTDNSTRNKFKKIFNIYKIINNKEFAILKILENNVTILDKLNYENWLKIIYSSSQVITPECGCTHISAACKVPVNIIYNQENLPEAIYKEYHPWKSNHKKFVFGDFNLNEKILKNLLI